MLGAQSHQRLDADCVENLLQSGYRNCLVFRLFVTANYLFTHTEPASEFSLRGSLCNPHLRDKGRDLIQAFDTGKSKLPGLKLVVFVELVLQLADHTFVAAANRGGTLSGQLSLHFRKSLTEAFYLGRCTFSLSIALDHDSDLTT